MEIRAKLTAPFTARLKTATLNLEAVSMPADSAGAMSAGYWTRCTRLSRTVLASQFRTSTSARAGSVEIVASRRRVWRRRPQAAKQKPRMLGSDSGRVSTAAARVATAKRCLAAAMV